VGRTRPDLYQLDPTGGIDGQVVTLVGGVATWATLPAQGLTNGHFTDQEVPTPPVDGATLDFYLASAHLADHMHLYLDGIRLMDGVGCDFVVTAGSAITMAYAPASGQNFFADYRHA
jgi:hypothetical protein